MEDSGHDQAQRLSLLMPQSCEQARIFAGVGGEHWGGKHGWQTRQTQNLLFIIFAFNVLRVDCLDHCFHRSVTIPASEIQNPVLYVQYTVYSIWEYRS